MPTDVRRVGLGLVALLVLAVAAGFVWEQLANLPRWEVTEVGAVLSQQAAQGQIQVELVFIAVGVVLCGLWAAVLGAWRRVTDWWLAPVVALTAVLAAVLTWQVGAALGPPDPSTVTGVELGDTFPDELATPSVAAFLLWPAAAMGGLVLGLLTTADHGSSAGETPDEGESGPEADHRLTEQAD